MLSVAVSRYEHLRVLLLLVLLVLLYLQSYHTALPWSSRAPSPVTHALAVQLNRPTVTLLSRCVCFCSFGHLFFSCVAFLPFHSFFCTLGCTYYQYAFNSTAPTTYEDCVAVTVPMSTYEGCCCCLYL